MSSLDHSKFSFLFKASLTVTPTYIPHTYNVPHSSPYTLAYICCFWHGPFSQVWSASDLHLPNKMWGSAFFPAPTGHHSGFFGKHLFRSPADILISSWCLWCSRQLSIFQGIEAMSPCLNSLMFMNEAGKETSNFSIRDKVTNVRLISEGEVTRAVTCSPKHSVEAWRRENGEWQGPKVGRKLPNKRVNRSPRCKVN